jgi:phenylacetate-CoA ligase
MDLYGPLYRSVFQPAWERWVRRRPTLEILAELERTQWCSLDELRALQLARLRRLLAHAYDFVPFYRRRFDEVGVGRLLPRDFDEVLSLPIVRRADAQSTFDERQSVGGPAPVIVKTTGGSTGEPLRFGYELASEHQRTAVKLRGYSWAGHHAGDRTLHFWGFPSKKPTSPITRTKIHVDRSLRREAWIDCTDRSDAHLAQVVALLARQRPSHLICYAQAGVDLARYVVENGLSSPKLTVICGAEHLYPSDRATLGRAFGRGVFETYGCREVMLIGSECEAHEGLHESMENVLVELVVHEQGRVRHARPGEVGEVVLTDLHNFAMPFIRYANGDLAVAGPETPCACGRGLARIASVQGRVTETLQDAAGRRVDGMVFNLIFSPIAAEVRRFRAVQRRDNSIVLEILPGIEVIIEEVSALPLSPSGKRQPIVVERR